MKYEYIVIRMPKYDGYVDGVTEELQKTLDQAGEQGYRVVETIGEHLIMEKVKP